MIRAIYLSPADYKRHANAASAAWGTPCTPLSYEGMPIISAGLLKRLGIEVPDVSTVYEIAKADNG